MTYRLREGPRRQERIILEPVVVHRRILTERNRDADQTDSGRRVQRVGGDAPTLTLPTVDDRASNTATWLLLWRNREREREFLWTVMKKQIHPQPELLERRL